MTEWRTIPSYPEYEASDEGQVRRRFSRRFKTQVFAPLSTHVRDDGYVALGLWVSTRSRTTCLHPLVCEAFHGPRPSPKHDAAHWDGDKLNNVPDNLRWATRADNEEDKKRHGRSNRGGERSGSAKMTPEQVQRLREVWPTLPRSTGGAKLTKGAADSLAMEFGVTRSALYQAVHGIRWSHI